jgi:hypothetical protein
VRCVCQLVVVKFFLLRGVPCLPFYSFQGEGLGYIYGKKVKWEKDERENRKGGLGCGRFPPYPVRAVSPTMQRCNRY